MGGNNFWVIFLALLIGCVIGFEIGKRRVSKQVHEFIEKVSNDLKVQAEELKKKADEENQRRQEAMDRVNKMLNDMMANVKQKQDRDQAVHNLVEGFDTGMYKVQRRPAGFSKKDEVEFCSSLIAKMSKSNASSEELANAVKYSMVVLDTEKKHLNWKQARDDLKIARLAETYFGESERE